MFEKLECLLSPITALAFLNLDRLYLLAGEGQFLKIFDHDAGRLLHTSEMFSTKALHGITYCNNEEQDKSSAIVLIWAGQLIRILSIRIVEAEDFHRRLQVKSLTTEIRAEDWIFDVCFRPLTSANSELACSNEVAIVTAHNQLYLLSWHPKSDDEDEVSYSLGFLGKGPQSNLYSSHILWLEPDTILVAGGTVFGEVILWSFRYAENSSFIGDSRLHYTFTGHEGSVFGVRVSRQIDGCGYRRVLASCSDDRTIRVWDISDLDSDTSDEPTTSCLATVMGHASRIWSVRFIEHLEPKFQILSLGEDGTAQTWDLAPCITGKTPLDDSANLSYTVNHNTTFAFHTGKNIWSATTFTGLNGNLLIATGGADGRIVSYYPSGQDGVTFCQYTMTEALASAREITDTSLLDSLTRKSKIQNIFKAMRKGSWDVTRTIQSAVSTYPSGCFSGVASCDARQATDKACDSENLYNEEGEFVTEQGFRMRATRQYAYRYQRISDTMSIWFIKPDDRATVDYLFHVLNFDLDTLETSMQDSATDKYTIPAQGDHLCIDDHYTAEYSFLFDGDSLEEWGVKYTVKGPNKDYIADARYFRASKDSVAHHRKPNESRKLKLDALKSYVWISEKDFLTTTEQGFVLLGSLQSSSRSNNLTVSVSDILSGVKWEIIGQENELRSSSRAVGVMSAGVALLTGGSGEIYQYQHKARRLVEIDPIYNSPNKISHLHANLVDTSWDSGLDQREKPKVIHELNMIGIISACLDSSTVEMSFLNPTKYYTDFFLHGSRKQRYDPEDFTTSSCFIDDEKRIVLGCRNGKVIISARLIYAAETELEEQSKGLKCNLHGGDAITAIQVLPRHREKANKHVFYLLTAGRDGICQIHEVDLSEPQAQLTCVHSITPPFGPCVEGVAFFPSTNELFLWGFRSKQFVLWNESQKTEVMTVECGGAHRNWAFQPLEDGRGGGSFVWTKASVCNVYSQAKASHQVLQPGGHGREIKALAISPPILLEDGSQKRFIATGAEDTAIRIFTIEGESSFLCSTIQTRHTTGIQRLSWSAGGDLLFSAAGCEEFFVWKIQELPLTGVGIVCKTQCPPVSDTKDLRIMDFAVQHVYDPTDPPTEFDYLIAMVYSDSSLRIFRYSTTRLEKSFQLASQGSYTSHCLTQVAFLNFGKVKRLCTASTDGHIAFWEWRGPSRHNHQSRELGTLTYRNRFSIHQNSIKSLLAVPLGIPEDLSAHLIITASDDQSIAISVLALNPSGTDLQHQILFLQNGHDSAVTSLAYLGPCVLSNSTNTTRNENENESENANDAINGFRFASVGSDQRLKIWRVGINSDLLLSHLTSPEGNSTKNNASSSTIDVKCTDVQREADMYTSVADASVLEGYCDVDGDSEEGEKWKVVVAGIGMEGWRCKM